MFDYSNFVPVFRVFNPRYGEIVETQSFRQAYSYARYESRSSLYHDKNEQRIPDEIIIIRVATGEILARFNVLADPEYAGKMW